MHVTQEQAQLLRKLREAQDSGDASHNDLCKWLSDELQDCCPKNSWCCFQDFVGDGQSGTVYFYCSGDLTSAPYTISQGADKMLVTIDMSQCMDVLQVTQYKTEGVQDNPAMESFRKMVEAKLYTAGPIPLCERNIPKSERDKMDPSDFAGKGQSFPIKKKGDAKAAAASIGRAGDDNYSQATLKKNTKALAKKHGISDELPQTWKDEDKAAEAARVKEAGARHSKSDLDLIQNIHDKATELGADCDGDTTDPGDMEEAAGNKKAAQAMHDKALGKKNQGQHDAAVKIGATCPPDCAMGAGDDDTSEAAAVEITGDAVSLREGAVGQDGTVLLKVITPGWGSCGYYPESVLERDLPKIYPAGTKNYWNHQTEAEERDRPEGDLRDLASVTTEPVSYLKDGPDGPGGYVRAKAFEAFKQPIEDLAKYIGTSIRAAGKAKEGKAPDGQSGKIIEQLTHGISIDYVTTPGAGGRVLQLFEAARGRAKQPTQQESQESTMADDQRLTEALAEIRKLKEQGAIMQAAGAVNEYFNTVRVSEAIKQRVTSRILAGTIPFTESGDLDRKKVKEFTEAQYNEELDFLRQINPSLVVGMGPKQSGTPTKEAVKEEKRADKQQQRKLMKESNRRFADLMESSNVKLSKVGRKILIEGRAAFNPNYNSRVHGAVVTGSGGSLPGLEA